MDKCKNCARQYFCKLVNNSSEASQNCKDYISWRETKNYGEVRRAENGNK